MSVGLALKSAAKSNQKLDNQKLDNQKLDNQKYATSSFYLG